jgi:ParB family chromosome partitioning protein
VWRDGVVVPSQKAGGTGANQHKKVARVSELKSELPVFDPGDVVAHRWRKKYCRKNDGKWVRDEDKKQRVIEDARRRAQCICEAEKDGTYRGTEGTGGNEWCTPKEYIELARAVLGTIDLDPATNVKAQETIQATKFYTEGDDGLQYEWHGRVWLNPPYAQPLIAEFVSKLCQELRSGRVTAAILLTHNCTDTSWFHEIIGVADLICFTQGRIKFYEPSGEVGANPTQGQAFSYFGPEAQRFEDVFCLIGACVRPSRGYQATGSGCAEYDAQDISERATTDFPDLPDFLKREPGDAA